MVLVIAHADLRRQDEQPPRGATDVSPELQPPLGDDETESVAATLKRISEPEPLAVGTETSRR